MTSPAPSSPTPRASPGNEDPGVKVSDLVVEFRNGRRRAPFRAVDGVSFDIREGETFALVGESGSGKTTTARAMLQLVAAAAGSIHYRGREVQSLSRSEQRVIRAGLQMIYQSPYSSLDPKMSVADLVAEPLRARREDAATLGRSVDDVLDAVGLGSIDRRARASRFSGGQRQRIAIARAIVGRPWFVVCDEPVSALDVSAQAQVLELLKQLQAERGMAYLFVSHDLAVVRSVAHRVGVMYRGRLVEVVSASALDTELRHPYSIALRAAVERAGRGERGRPQRRILLSGDVGTEDGPQEGCAFRGRCWLYGKMGQPAVCREESPHLDRSDGLRVACHFPAEGKAAIEQIAG